MGILVLAAPAIGAAWTPSGKDLNHRRWHVLDMRGDKCLNTWQPKPMSEVRYLLRSWHFWGGVKERTQAKDSRCLSETLMRWYYNSGAKCVHEHEGPWNANTGNGYYGGFQADLSFASTYGAEYYPPTPDQWTPLEQIHMAYRGWKGRGWAPWPNTARACGLL